MKKWLLISLFLPIVSLPVFCETVTMVVTGQTHAHFEQCGCPDDPQGGLEARAAYLEVLKNEVPDFALIDIGGFLPENTTPIDAAVGQTYLQAMCRLKYHFVLLGESDLEHGYGYLSGLFKSNPQPQPISTNLEAEGQKAFWNGATRISKNNIEIGLLGLSSLKSRQPTNESVFAISTSNDIIASQIKALNDEKACDAIVLLAHEPSPVVIRWLKKYKGPSIDMIVTLDLEEDVQKHDDIFIVNAPGEGREIGRIDMQITKGEGLQDVQFTRTVLDPQKMESQSMRTFLNDSYNRMVNELDLQYEGPYPLQDYQEEKDMLNEYMGGEECKGCHEDQYIQWEETKHARAFDNLLDKNRHWVPEMLARMVTGYGHETGFESIEESDYLLQVQCETCHGPGLIHVEGMGTAPIRNNMTKELCMECHTKEYDPKFEKLFDLFYKQVKH